MYLKTLEIQGFKSFAARTPFEFGPGITAIVGPNGVGKTNVAEALRWVLGEQASRSLRARRLEDVIFVGSSKKAPVGMAEVSITLDNKDGWLPIDFSEVVVTRRTYRDGESEYLINRSRVRLRDVIELFQRAQVGQSSYAFIGQGLVETMLSLRPEERRGLVEEAADVRRYRVKLQEAQDRLAATHDNLERVNLLTSEIAPRLSQLERQAGHAAAYTRLNEELAEALRTWYGHRWQQAQESLTAARALNDQRREECERAQAQASTCEEGLAALQSAIEKRRRDIASREGAFQELTDQLRQLDQAIALDEERRTLLTSRQEELRGETAELEKEIEGQATAVAGAAERQAAIDAEVEAARSRAAAAREELEGLENEITEAERKALSAEEEERRARTELEEREGRVHALEARAEWALGAQEKEERRADLLARLAALGREFRHAVAADKERAARLDTLTREQAALEAKLAEDRAALASTEEELTSIRLRRQEVEMRLELQSSAQSRYGAFSAGVRSVLAAAGLIGPEEGASEEPVTLEGVVGMVARLLRVPANLERAIEAALAENLEAIVFEHLDDALAALEMLTEQESGLITAYPLDSLREVHPVNLMNERGIVGVASRLVSCDGRYRQLIDTLLGRTIVVDDLAMAHKVVKRGLGSVVTLDGVLLRPVGSVSGGRSPRAEAFFARERQIQEAPQELQRLDLARREAEARVESLHESIAATEASLTSGREELDGLRTTRVAAGEGLARHHSRLAALRGETHWFHEEIRLADEARARAVSEKARLEDDLAQLRGERKSCQERAAEARKTANELAARRSALQETLAEAGTDLAAVEGERRSQGLLLENLESGRARLEKHLESRKQHATDLEEQLTTLHDRLEKGRRERETRGKELATVRQELEPAHQELTQLQSRERSLSEELGAARTRLLEAERGLLEAESELGRREEELDTLRADLEREGLALTGDGEVVARSEPTPPVPPWLAAHPQGAGPDNHIPPIRGGAQTDPTQLKGRISELRSKLRGLGPVNAQAQVEYSESKERYDFLTGQTADLEAAEASLREAIGQLEEIIRRRFDVTFEKVNEEFRRYFATFFSGGHAELTLDEDGGLEIIARPPGKRLGNLSLLSGGERALTAVALLFALLQIHPSPICVLDEVDAMLDDANVGRFGDALRQLAERTQFLIITHNRKTIETADHIYGVSMGPDSTSSVLSLRLADVPAN
jgi:chromosome segregation protein